jgi:hypothetical protein
VRSRTAQEAHPERTGEKALPALFRSLPPIEATPPGIFGPQQAEFATGSNDGIRRGVAFDFQKSQSVVPQHDAILDSNMRSDVGSGDCTSSLMVKAPFQPEPRHGFFHDRGILSRQAVAPAGALDSLPSQARAKVHSRSSARRETPRAFAASGEA